MLSVAMLNYELCYAECCSFCVSMYIGVQSASSFRLINVCCWLTLGQISLTFVEEKAKSYLFFFLNFRFIDENQTQIKHDIRLNDISHNDIQHKS